MVTIVKALTWRAIAAGTTMATVYALTGDVKSAGASAAIAGTIKFFLYMGHERVYTRFWPKSVAAE